jgi:hypothetical protein
MENMEYRVNQLEEWRKEASEIMSQLKVTNAVNTEIVRDLKDSQKWATRYSIMTFVGIIVAIAINVLKG